MMMVGLLYLGLFALAAGMARHKPALAGPWQQARLRTWLHPVGWALLALSLLPAMGDWDGGVALVSWCGLLPVAGGALMLGLTYRPGWLRIGLGVALALIAIDAITRL